MTEQNARAVTLRDLEAVLESEWWTSDALQRWASNQIRRGSSTPSWLDALAQTADAERQRQILGEGALEEQVLLGRETGPLSCGFVLLALLEKRISDYQAKSILFDLIDAYEVWELEELIAAKAPLPVTSNGLLSKFIRLAEAARERLEQ